jgi:hypothetical protein
MKIDNLYSLVLAHGLAGHGAVAREDPGVALVQRLRGAVRAVDMADADAVRAASCTTCEDTCRVCKYPNIRFAAAGIKTCVKTPGCKATDRKSHVAVGDAGDSPSPTYEPTNYGTEDSTA